MGQLSLMSLKPMLLLEPTTTWSKSVDLNKNFSNCLMKCLSVCASEGLKDKSAPEPPLGAEPKCFENDSVGHFAFASYALHENDRDL